MRGVHSGAVIIGLLGALTACAPQATEENTAEVVPVVERLDTREIIPLNQMQRENVLAEMRALLIASQGVIEGLALDDMQVVQDAANTASMKAQGTIENKQNMQRLGMGRVLPLEFRQMGQSTHLAFGEIAQMAADGKLAMDIQLKLVETMNTCVACHSAYQIPNP